MTRNQRSALAEIEGVLKDLSISYEVNPFAEAPDGVRCVCIATDNMNQYDVADLQDRVCKDFEGCYVDMGPGSPEKGFYAKEIYIFNAQDIDG